MTTHIGFLVNKDTKEILVDPAEIFYDQSIFERALRGLFSNRDLEPDFKSYTDQYKKLGVRLSARELIVNITSSFEEPLPPYLYLLDNAGYYHPSGTPNMGKAKATQYPPLFEEWVQQKLRTSERLQDVSRKFGLSNILDSLGYAQEPHSAGGKGHTWTYWRQRRQVK